VAEAVELVDALGQRLRFGAPPARIVSLVPSITETLFWLGAGERVVGVTEYCVHPDEALRTRVVVGGTKNPKLDRVAALAPDLVIANHEENRRRDVERLIASGTRVWVTYARSVRGAIEEIAQLGRLTGAEERSAALVAGCEAALARAAARAHEPRTRAVAPIWRDPWMLVGADTFADDLLRCCGAANPFAARGERYPRATLGEIAASAPDVILLPTEPYAFGERDRLELAALDCPAARDGRVHVIEGELLSWYGPRIPRALDAIARLVAREPA
jgi:ABC-type Fe3+-hydroxamate transport system substrate-binding protein